MDTKFDTSQHLQYEVQNIDLDAIGLAHNYSLLLNKLEKLAFGDGEHSHVEERGHHVMSEAEYSRFISDIWIGVVLTLLILSIIFFICSCFLYHKFQQWKNSYRTNSPEPMENARRYDLDVESLPSYTIVSGLPTYDDALEQFRKAGIILQPPSVIKLFEDVGNNKSGENTDGDNISLNSTCTCGASAPNPTGSTLMPPVIELNPEHLAILSQKRLSLQIALNSSIRRSSRSGRVDLCRQVNRSNLLRTHDIPQIHRSNSSSALSTEHNLLTQRLKNVQHRGSLY